MKLTISKVIDELYKNPHKTFICSTNKIQNVDGILIFKEPINFNDMWEEETYSIDVIQAFNAYENDKNIKCILNNKEYVFEDKGRKLWCHEKLIWITTQMILEGEWYILD